jgi:hypothetical protein
MTEDRDIKKDLELSVGDYAHIGVRAGLSTAPFLGGSLAEFFSVVITPPLEKRRDSWLIEIFTRLKKLEEQIEEFKIENLGNNENFISTLLYATQVAMRTHRQEKLDALRNAVLNSALNPTVDENLQLMFLNLVDRYTPWHLTLLQFLVNPKEYGKNHNIKYVEFLQGSLGTVIEMTFSDLVGKDKFYIQIIKEMISNGLLQEGVYYQGGMTEQGMFASRTTDMGKQFLDFIKNPVV